MLKKILLIYILVFSFFSFSNESNATFVGTGQIIYINSGDNEEIFSEIDIQEILTIEIMIGWLIMIIFNILIPFQGRK